MNQRLFGVDTDFNEEDYTTKLDKSHPRFKEKEIEAIKIANEIQNTETDNIHIAEERNQSVKLDELDEELKYSSVIRDTTSIESQTVIQSKTNGKAINSNTTTTTIHTSNVSNTSNVTKKPSKIVNSNITWSNVVKKDTLPPNPTKPEMKRKESQESKSQSQEKPNHPEQSAKESQKSKESIPQERKTSPKEPVKTWKTPAKPVPKSPSTADSASSERNKALHQIETAAIERARSARLAQKENFKSFSQQISPVVLFLISIDF